MFRFDSKLYQFVGKAVCLVKLHFLWLLFSLPLITMGAANCALHDTAVKILKNREGYIFQNFWSVFRETWKRTLGLWLAFLGTGAGLWLDFWFWRGLEGDFARGMGVIVGALGLCWLFLALYAFPLASRMKTDFRTTLRNAGLLAFKYLPRTLYMSLWAGIFWIAGRLWAPALFVELTAGMGLLAMIQGRVLCGIFEKEQVPERL